MLFSLFRKKCKSINRTSLIICGANSFILPSREEGTSKTERDSEFKDMLMRDLPSSVYGVLQDHWKRIGVD